jgi:DNA mismatch repair ATPase MutS
MTHAIKCPLSPGDQITYTVPGTSATVTVHRTDSGYTGEQVFLVHVAQGAHRPAGWTHTYVDETAARFEATRAAQLLKRYGSADRIEARRDELIATVREQEQRQARRMHDQAALAAAGAELDTLLSLADMAALMCLRADLGCLAVAP